ncbi:MAG TPA: HAD-IC family P-type ATPase [Gemmatimonadaceae bacterium]
MLGSGRTAAPLRRSLGPYGSTATAQVLDEQSSPWHSLSADQVVDRTGASARGLSASDVEQRRARHGLNALPPARGEVWWRIVLRQLRGTLVLLLILASIVAVVSGEIAQAVAIAAVMAINVGLGLATETRARRAILALSTLDVRRANVLRGGVVRSIDARELVPGDIVLLEAGARVPADARVLEATELETNEALLTGESLPVAKRAEPVSLDAGLADRNSMVYAGSLVSRGAGRALVIATGSATELGRISTMMGAVKRIPSPLERRLETLGRQLAAAALLAVLIVVLSGLVAGASLMTLLQEGVALAVAAIPEGLPAVATISLAVGAWRMARHRVIVRDLAAVESLGAMTVVCVDKTGTLTSGMLTLTTIALPGGDHARVKLDGTVSQVGLRGALATAAAASIGSIDSVPPVGDPIDVACLMAARASGIERHTVLGDDVDVGVVPFDNSRMFSATFVTHGSATRAYVKGATTNVLARCAFERTDGEVRVLARSDRSAVHDVASDLATSGLRVLALAEGPVSAARESALTDLTFAGLIGLTDPEASGARSTVAALQRAGIRILMLTGDRPDTAFTIAHGLGIARERGDVLPAAELAAHDAAALAPRLATVGVIARVTPDDKLRVVDALQARGEIVGFVGDGVNDAPALRQADVGVAMGGRGADVAKEAASLVLQDDSLGSVRVAVEQGRTIFDNIQKSVLFLVSCNLAELLLLFVASFLGWPVLLTALQILWINLLTDALPALSLAVEPAEADVATRAPRPPGSRILDRDGMTFALVYSVLMASASLGALLLVSRTSGIPEARTAAFATVVLAQLLHLGTARGVPMLVRAGSVFGNSFAIIAVVAGVLLLLAAVYAAPLSNVLELEPLSARSATAAILFAAIPAIIGQVHLAWRARARGTP